MLYFGVLAHVVAQARLEFIPGQCHVVYHHTWFMLLDLFIYLFFWILVSRSVLLTLQHPDSRLKLPGLKTLLGERAAVALCIMGGPPSLRMWNTAPGLVSSSSLLLSAPLMLEIWPPAISPSSGQTKPSLLESWNPRKFVWKELRDLAYDLVGYFVVLLGPIMTV